MGTYVRQHTFQDGTSADGGQVRNEIDNLGKSVNNITTDQITDGTIVNADISASAAIAYSKLAALTSGNILVGSAGNVATSVNPSGDVDVDNAGVFSIASGAIVNADVNASAAIDITKLANGSAWATWTPTFDLIGAGTLSAGSTSFARWMRIGNIVWFAVDATHTVSSSDAASVAITFTLPVNTTAVGHIFTCLVKDPSIDTVLVPGFARHIHSVAANTVYVYKVFSGTGEVPVYQEPWSNGTLREIWVQGFYEVV